MPKRKNQSEGKRLLSESKTVEAAPPPKRIRIKDPETGDDIELDADGYEVRSDDGSDAGEDLQDFIIDEEVPVEVEPPERTPTINTSNIISGKRIRKPVQRYEDTEEFKETVRQLYLGKEPVESIDEDRDGDADAEEKEPVATTSTAASSSPPGGIILTVEIIQPSSDEEDDSENDNEEEEDEEEEEYIAEEEEEDEESDGESEEDGEDDSEYSDSEENDN